VIPNIETFPLNEPVPGGTGQAPDIINRAPRDSDGLKKSKSDWSRYSQTIALVRGSTSITRE
jgi:hypothetical protein